MRVMAEWYEEMGSCCVHQCVEFEGETKEEIEAKIRARTGNADVMVVGLHNAIDDYAAYTGVPAAELAQEYPYGFADSPQKPGTVSPIETPSRRRRGWFLRALDRLALG